MRRQILVGALLIGVVTTVGVRAQADKPKPYNVPQSAAVENAVGIRVTSVSVVGDRGLLDVRYVVLDAQKARRFEKQQTSEAKLRNKRDGTVLQRIASMKHEHDLRQGQTYYMIVLNTGGSVKPGDQVDLTIMGQTLTGVPVR
jgi:hypothetical protein